VSAPSEFRSGIEGFQAEREYWESHDAAAVVDWAGARQVVFPNLKASTDWREDAV
jgi:hypothetical protein